MKSLSSCFQLVKARFKLQKQYTMVCGESQSTVSCHPFSVVLNFSAAIFYQKGNFSAILFFCLPSRFFYPQKKIPQFPAGSCLYIIKRYTRVQLRERPLLRWSWSLPDLLPETQPALQPSLRSTRRSQRRCCRSSKQSQRRCPWRRGRWR